ncbi:MAG: trypsin-like peptidase domain-containing protein [Alphaproteobacteria bacterium]|nr:trypsin-like peptidase domain-containing protein [Alphaproteobacteria bacterium]
MRDFTDDTDEAAGPQVCSKDLKKYFFVIGVVALVVLFGAYAYRQSTGGGVSFSKLLANLGGNPAVNLPVQGNQAGAGGAMSLPVGVLAAPPSGAGGLATMPPMVETGGGPATDWAGSPDFSSVARLLRNSVVSVTATSGGQGVAEPLSPTGVFPDGQFRFAPPMARAVENMGSGVIIRSDGYILTNYHVVRGANSVFVNVLDDFAATRYAADIVKMDESLDLALLKVTPKTPLHAAVLGDSDAVRVADAVLAIGSPFGLDMTVSRGIISAKRKSLVIEGVTHTNLLQTDAAINQGNSGGPLVARNGAVIGINTAIYTPTGAFAGIGFSVPSNQARLFAMDELNSLPGSTVEGPSMGLVAFQGAQGNGGFGQQQMGAGAVGAAGPPIMAGVTSPHRDGRQNMVCTNCHDLIGGAGQRTVAGQGQPMMPVAAPVGAVPPPIMAGISSPHADGREKMACTTCHTLLPARAGVVAMPGPGAGGSPYQFAQPPASLAMNVQAGAGTGRAGGMAPDMPGPGGSMNMLGAYLQAMQPFLAQKLNQPAGRGVFVSGVVPDSPAFAAGLKAGDIILKADGRPVKAPQDISAQLTAMADGRPVRLGILRDGEPRNLDIAPSVMGRAAALQGAPQAGMAVPQAGMAPQQIPMMGAPIAGMPQAKPVVPSEFSWLGIEIESFQQVPGAVGAPQGTMLKGASIAEVKRGSKAQVNGLAAGDVILEVNNRPTGNAAQLDQSIKGSAVGQPVLIKVHRNGQEFFVVL